MEGATEIKVSVLFLCQQKVKKINILEVAGGREIVVIQRGWMSILTSMVVAKLMILVNK